MISAMKDIPIFYYEKFCINPKLVLRSISKILNIQYDKSFLKNFQDIKLRGDSWRKSLEIMPRERRNAVTDFKNNLKNCKNYLEICNILKYEPNYNNSFPYLIN